MYREYFGFKALPFASAPDPKVFYLNPVYQAALATLQYGILAKKGVMVVTGACGTGKTALLWKLFDDLGASVKPVWVVNGGVSIANVLSTTLAELDLKPESGERTAMIDALHGHLIERAKKSEITCLVIEEAHNLDSETLDGLRQLCNLEAHSQKLLQLILVGHPEFIKKLDEPAHHSLKQRVALHCRLFALTRGELDRYIDFHLRAVGHHDGILFDPSATASIADYSGGIPRLVNGICDNALLAACRVSQKQISRALIDEVAKDMHLVSEQQTSPTASLDGDSWVSRKEAPAANSQRETVESNVRPRRGTAKTTMTAPRRRVIRIFGAGLLALIPLGGAGWALYFHEAMPFLEYLKSQLLVVNSRLTHSTIPTETEPVTSLSRPQPAIDDHGAAELAAGHAAPDTLAPATVSPDLESSAPPPQELKSEEKRANEMHSPGVSARRDRSVQDPAVKRRLLEINVHKAILNRAIEGVSVKLIGETIYLDGRVASERQKSLAERAALGVTEVAKVDNRLEIQRQ